MSQEDMRTEARVERGKEKERGRVVGQKERGRERWERFEDVILLLWRWRRSYEPRTVVNFQKLEKACYRYILILAQWKLSSTSGLQNSKIIHLYGFKVVVTYYRVIAALLFKGLALPLFFFLPQNGNNGSTSFLKWLLSYASVLIRFSLHQASYMFSFDFKTSIITVIYIFFTHLISSSWEN